MPSTKRRYSICTNTDLDTIVPWHHMVYEALERRNGHRPETTRIFDPVAIHEMRSYRSIRDLPQRDFYGLLVHDVNAAVTTGAGSISHFLIGGKEVAGDIRYVAQLLDDPTMDAGIASVIYKRLGLTTGPVTPQPDYTLNNDLLTIMESRLSQVPGDLATIPEKALIDPVMLHRAMNEPFIQKGIESALLRIPVFQRIFPVILSSMRFLNEPNTNDFGTLTQNHVLLTEVARYFFSEVTGEPHERWIRGHELIILFNLLRNANKKHDQALLKRKNVPVLLGYDEQSALFTVTNYSDTGIRRNQKIYEPKVKGNDGNTGFGLAIAQFYADLFDMGLDFESTRLGKGDYRITFWMGPKEKIAEHRATREKIRTERRNKAMERIKSSMPIPSVVVYDAGVLTPV